MIIKNIHPKLLNGIQHMIIKDNLGLPYYGEYNLYINFCHQESVGTCGVNVTRNGMNFYYSEKFLDRLTQEEVNFIILHEDFHLIFDHPQRTVNGGYDRKLANIVQDMIINHIIVEEIQKPMIDKNINFVDIPKDEDGKTMALFVPKEYTGKLVFEELYNWMLEQKEEHDKNKSSENSQDKEEGNSEDGYGPNAKDPGNEDGTIDNPSLSDIFDNLDQESEYLDKHLADEVSKELRDTITKEVRDKLKGRGLESAEVQSILGKLIKKRKDYLKDIKRSVSNIIFGSKKSKTISRPNRRQIKGLKGNRKNQSKINVILDVSGSMSGLMERVLNYVYQNDIIINMIQADTKVNKFEVIKNKKDLDNLEVVGFGGTVMQPSFDYVSEKLNKYNTVLLTDGYTDTLDLSNIKGNVLIISAGTKSPISNNPKGRLKQIIIEND
jgi:predicted metal-dependent peptidase